MPQRDAQALAQALSERFLAAICVWIIIVLADAWALMVLVGIFHGETGTPAGTLGYLISVPTVVLVRFITTPVRIRRGTQ